MTKRLVVVDDEPKVESEASPIKCVVNRRDAAVRIGSWIVYLGALGSVAGMTANCGPATPENTSGAQNSPTPSGTATPTGSGTPTPTGSATPTGTPSACGCGTTPSGSAWHNTSLKASQVPLNAVAYNSTTQIFICHDDQGFYAMDSLCPHEGCDIGTSNGHYTASNLGAGFTCYCHTSVFDGNGNKVSGPTPTGLPHYALTTDSSGNFFVNWSSAVSKDCRC